MAILWNWRRGHLVATLWFLSQVHAQSIAPSNGTQDLYPSATSPRFIMNGTQISDIPVIPLAPLGPYAEMSHASFVKVEAEGHLVNVNATNANDIANTQQFSYISCDPEAYSGNLGPAEVFRIVVNSPRANIIILYSETSDHCVATGLSHLPTIGGVLTTTDTMLAKSLADLDLDQRSAGTVIILPDLNSYTNSSNGAWGSGSGSFNQSPTTAVAMIILYAITGIITALFLSIIITGTIRAHRHPERYGPRNIIGRGRQSRAKGIARAMLETLPIVKFGDHQNLPKKSTDGNDVEMNGAQISNSSQVDQSDSIATDRAALETTTPTDNESKPNAPPTVSPTENPDGTDADGHLGCSICTEEFQKGEELRVLPCNHKFHPDCIDPWLLNVSGTCPLCRVDLNPQNVGTDEGNPEVDAPMIVTDGRGAPPLIENASQDLGSSAGGRRDTAANLRHLAMGTRDERISALRRLRLERAHRPTDAERQGLTSRFRERFRIRTERRDTGVDPPRRRSSAVNVPSTFFG